MIMPRLSLFSADSWNYIYSQSNTIGATTLSQTLNIARSTSTALRAFSR